MTAAWIIAAAEGVMTKTKMTLRDYVHARIETE